MKIHFSGVGGIGISALARYFLSNGCKVSGSDIDESALIKELKNEGISWVSPNENFSSDTDLHIYSEAVPKNDIQRIFSKDQGIKSISYFKALGEISEIHKTIAICGTHGKSTTTAMIGIAMKNLEQNALTIVGTKVREFNGKNVYLSKNRFWASQNDHDKWFIVEACEYRENFLHILPFGIVLLNCEWDHIDYYKTFESYKNAYIKFIKKIPKDGFLVANFDDEIVREIAGNADCKIIPVYLSKIKNHIKLKVLGWFNQLNAELAKSALIETIGKEKQNEIISSLEKYAGAWRRFDILREKDGITVIDDYAHHPTEIIATLGSLEKYKDKHIIIVFQPHQYSRTLELFDGFVKSFDSLKSFKHKLFITDIYEARDSDEDKALVSSQKLVENILKRGVDAEYSGNYESTLIKVNNIILPNTLLLTMGAGPVNEVSENFLKSII